MIAEQARPVTLEQFAARDLRNGVGRVAVRLRDLADQVERAASDVDRVGQPGRPTYARIAETVVHDLTWGVANLHVEQLISDAVAADIARAKGQ